MTTEEKSIFQDQRVKINENRKQAIREKYAEVKNYRKIAEIFGISLGSARYIINPDELKQYNERRKLRKQDWKKYYNKEKHTIANRRWRAKKRII